MNLLKLILLTSLIVINTNTQAALIKASDFVAGTEISQLDSNTTISFLQNLGGSTNISPVSIQGRGYWSASNSNSFGGLVYDLYMPSRGISRAESLDDLYASSWGFSALLISYATPTRQLVVNGYSPFGDGFMALAFDKNGELLEYQGISGSTRCLGLDPASGSCVNGFAFGDILHFENAAHHVVIGGMFSATYVESIDVSLPEPSPLLLLSLLGVTLALRGRRHKIKNRLLG